MGRPKKIKDIEIENIDQAEIAEHAHEVESEVAEPVKQKTISREDEILNALAGIPVNVTFQVQDGTLHISKGSRVESLRMDWDINLIVKTAQRICM